MANDAPTHEDHPGKSAELKSRPTVLELAHELIDLEEQMTSALENAKHRSELLYSAQQSKQEADARVTQLARSRNTVLTQLNNCRQTEYEGDDK